MAGERLFQIGDLAPHRGPGQLGELVRVTFTKLDLRSRTVTVRRKTARYFEIA